MLCVANITFVNYAPVVFAPINAPYKRVVIVMGQEVVPIAIRDVLDVRPVSQVYARMIIIIVILSILVNLVRVGLVPVSA